MSDIESIKSTETLDYADKLFPLDFCIKSRITYLESRLAESQRKVEELAEKFGWTYCAYCEEKFPADAPDLTDKIPLHISICEKHPNNFLAQENARLKALLGEAVKVLGELYNDLLTEPTRERVTFRKEDPWVLWTKRTKTISALLDKLQEARK